MSQTKALHQLQEIEQQIRQVQTRLTEIDSIINNDEATRQARQAVADAETALKPLRVKAKSLEDELETNTGKTAETEDRLYSGSVSNPKALQEMQQEVEFLKTRRAELEDTLFEVVMELESAENTLQTRQDALNQTIQARHAENEQLLLEQDAKQTQLASLQSQHEATAGSIPDEHLQLYQQLKPRTRDEPVATMTADGNCSRCGVQQTRSDETDIRRGKLVQCNNCRRIMIFR